MGYKLGALVSYNDENWVIIDVKTKEISDGQLIFLKIKNVLSQEILNVSSNVVKEVEIKPIKEEQRENLEDTQYIQSFFNGVGEEDSDEFFNLGEEESLFDIEEIEIDSTLKSIEKDDEIKLNEEEENEVLGKIDEPKNFERPDTRVHFSTPINPDLTGSLSRTPAVDETLSDMEPVAIFNKEKRVSNNSLDKLYETPKIMPSRVRGNDNSINIFDNNVAIKNSIFNNQNEQKQNDYNQSNIKDKHNHNYNNHTNFENNQNMYRENFNNSNLQYQNSFSNAAQENVSSITINNDSLEQNINASNKVQESVITNDNTRMLSAFERKIGSIITKEIPENKNNILETQTIKTKEIKTELNSIENKPNNNFEVLKETNIEIIKKLKNKSENQNIIDQNQSFEKKMADPNIYDYTKDSNKPSEPVFNESFEDSELTASQTDKLVIEGLANKDEKVIEKHFDALTTGPLNTKKLLDNFNKQQKIAKNLDLNFKESLDENENNIFGQNSQFNKKALNESIIYKRFKTLTCWLIFLFVIGFITPLVGIFMKSSYAYLDLKSFNFNQILAKVFHMYLFETDAFINFKVYAIGDIVLIILTPMLLFTFAIYLIVYLVCVSDKQYKKIAFYNFELGSKIEVIEQIQEFNNETSLYLLKIHNDMKKIKKEVKSFKTKDNTNTKSEKEQPINIQH
ncbi:hypothetical protein [Spiroplasma tabanidicola]|uniref:Uncharacterized protein n=1 Tax=Spiroplasma tabanidicola TaxID=324079 RepID=A0A6I6C6B3_9MOLU|nr:hypothetical protein [Spiroplasma tabanidicola]QGS51700.1 hypothetical protein STABA_v1c03370 [Spiroplasma tabanidicola]